jgi:transposase-like protein
MGARRIAVIAVSGALVAGGTGAAIAAVTRDDPKKTEQAVLDDAAKRLNVTSQQLHDALAAAQDAQLDDAVKAGRLTQKQADEVKAMRKKSGSVLGGPLGGPRSHGGPRLYGGPDFRGGPGMPGRIGGGLIGDLAGALGLKPDKLFEQLRSGKSVADVAKAQGKSLDDVRTAVRSATKARLDKAVKAGDLTQKQADAMLAHFDTELGRIESGKRLMGPRDRHLRGKLPPAPPLRPGALAPGEGPPDLAPPPDTFSG